MAQVEILMRALKSEAEDYLAKSSSVTKKFESLSHSAEVLLDVIGSLTKRELLERLDALIDGLNAVRKGLEELRPYAEVAITRGKDLMTRYPEEAYRADIPGLMRAMIKLEHSRRRIKLEAENLKLRLLRIREKVQ